MLSNITSNLSHVGVKHFFKETQYSLQNIVYSAVYRKRNLLLQSMNDFTVKMRICFTPVAIINEKCLAQILLYEV